MVITTVIIITLEDEKITKENDYIGKSIKNQIRAKELELEGLKDKLQRYINGEDRIR